MKSSIYLVFIFAVSALLLCIPAHAQWTTNGPYGGFVSTLVKDGAIIYAAAGNKIYQSSNDGSYWTKSSEQVLYQVSTLISSGGKIFAGTGSHGVLASADAGATWTQKNNGLAPGQVDLMFSNLSGIFAAKGDDLFFSANDGNSWLEVGTGLDNINTQIQTLMQYGDTLFAGTNGQYGRLFMSTDNGQNFSAVSGFPAMNAVYKMTYEGDNIYVGTWSGVFKSADRGASWAASGSGMSGGYTTAMIAAHNKIFASTPEGGIFVSINDGATWTSANTGIMGWFNPNSAPYPYAVSMIETNAGLVAATNDGIYVSADSGSTWNRSNANIETNRMQSLAAKDDYVYGGAGRMYVSSNKGISWNLSQNGLEGSNILAITVNGSITLASTANQKLYRSTNNGTSWTETGAEIMGRVDVLASNEQRIVAIVRQVGTANQQLMQSFDGGLTFSQVPGATSIGGMMRAIGLYENRIYVGNDRGMIFRTDNNGLTWRDIGFYLPSVAVTEILALVDQTFVSTAGKGVFRFTNNDYTMENFIDGLPNYEITDLVKEDSLIFASTGGAGIYATQLGSENWFNVTGDLPNLFVSHLASGAGKIYAGTSTGVYQINEETFKHFKLISGVKEERVPLLEIFPNPVKHTLCYEVNETSTLELMDLNCLVVRSIGNAFGTGFMELNDLNEGIYLLRITTAKGTETKKIVVQH